MFSIVPASDKTLFVVVLQDCCGYAQSMVIAVVKILALSVGAAVSAFVSRMTGARAWLQAVAMIRAVVLTGTVCS